MRRKQKLSKIDLLRRHNLELNQDLKAFKEKNVEFYNTIVEKSERIQYLEKKNKFNQERITERDIRNDSLMELIEEYREVIAILGRESIRHRNYIENSRHSQAMQEITAMPPNEYKSMNFSSNQKVLEEDLPKKSSSLAKPKSKTTKRRKVKRK